MNSNVLKILYKIPENKICFDCNNNYSEWISVKLGIFLCTNCSGNHRGYGRQISIIKSISLDIWDETSIKYALNGGNYFFNTYISIFFKNFAEIKNKIINYEFYKSNLVSNYKILLESKINCNNYMTISFKNDEYYAFPSDLKQNYTFMDLFDLKKEIIISNLKNTKCSIHNHFTNNILQWIDSFLNPINLRYNDKNSESILSSTNKKVIIDLNSKSNKNNSNNNFDKFQDLTDENLTFFFKN